MSLKTKFLNYAKCNLSAFFCLIRGNKDLYICFCKELNSFSSCNYPFLVTVFLYMMEWNGRKVVLRKEERKKEGWHILLTLWKKFYILIWGFY